MHKKTAYQIGQQVAIENVKVYPTIEELIFDAMRENPYKGQQSRKDYIAGVSAWCNLHECRKNRAMNESSLRSGVTMTPQDDEDIHGAPSLADGDFPESGLLLANVVAQS